MRLGLRLQDDKFLTLSSIVFVLSLRSSTKCSAQKWSRKRSRFTRLTHLSSFVCSRSAAFFRLYYYISFAL